MTAPQDPLTFTVRAMDPDARRRTTPTVRYLDWPKGQPIPWAVAPSSSWGRLERRLPGEWRGPGSSAAVRGEWRRPSPERVRAGRVRRLDGMMAGPVVERPWWPSLPGG
jgi:hypothetical protein